MACIIALFTLWGYKTIQNQFVQPQAILVLGGSTRLLEREKFTANLAHKYPHIPIWISGGSPPQHTKKIFANAGVDLRRLHLDYEAVDTVTNFTTLVDELQSRGIKSVYLITSDFHMVRACVIGEIVLGSRGINFKPVSVPSKNSPEPIEKSIRDAARAVIWVATGYTGANHAKNKPIQKS
ncbi:YdcF family protein [Dolichospermum circinale]|uniref:YdcF family protein n=1 Tax=Dolichospermum circinale TaxID=109265 RepID=UPI00232F7D29|nr:YdcF family protein [Dolichospermum circinale]MDB9468208.1 YdcF family protein [Dolichospermum circinale CS-539/09]MDB9470155.1 YdcF family protein [Dolichospermum circinale CS-539]